MGHFEAEIARAVILALFVPLIISSGGNSGSQASTLVVRALALGELKAARLVARRPPRARRRPRAGIDSRHDRLCAYPHVAGALHPYGEHYMLVALTVATSLIASSRGGRSPARCCRSSCAASASTRRARRRRSVATLVDVSGIVIYFTMASLFLGGTLL